MFKTLWMKANIFLTAIHFECYSGSNKSMTDRKITWAEFKEEGETVPVVTKQESIFNFFLNRSIQL